MSAEIFQQKSDPMMELFNSERFSFLPSVKHSRGHKRFAVLFIVWLVLVSEFAIFRLAPSVKANPDWLSGWSYRKSHVINNATGAGTLYQKQVTVHYGSGTDGDDDVYLNSHCRTDFGDVRFTDDDGSTLLDYWMESKVDSDYAIFWVEVADDLSTVNVTIYVYYGNGGATTTSNGTSTFIEWKNMETDPFTTYSAGDGATHQVSTTKVKEGTYSVYHNLHDTSKIGFSTSVGSAKQIIEFWYYKVTPTSRDNDVTFHLTNTQATSPSGALIYYNSTGGITWYDGSRHSGTGTFATNTWHLFTIVVNTNNNFFKLWVDGTLSIASGTCYSSVPTSYFSMFNTAGTANDPDYVFEGYIDAWRVRKYVDPEPAHGSWGSEEGIIDKLMRTVSSIRVFISKPLRELYNILVIQIVSKLLQGSYGLSQILYKVSSLIYYLIKLIPKTFRTIYLTKLLLFNRISTVFKN